MAILSAEVSECSLSLRLFGPFAAHCGGRPLPKMRTRKEQWLLALLTLYAGETLDRVWLATTLWPEGTQAAALGNLRRSLGILRAALGTEAHRILAPTARTLQLVLADAACDVRDFDAAVRRSDEASLETAVALYRGPLLLGCLEEWAIPEREARERAVLDALETLAASAQKRGRLSGAASYLGRALEIDPLRETVLRALLKVLVAQGSHAAAAETYYAFRRRLRRELNAEPDPETIAFYRRLQAEERRPTPQTAPRGLAEPLPQLPSRLTALIGRQGETEAVIAALDDARLVTLTGTAGVGKTRIALAVAGKLHEEFPGGAWFADLAPLVGPKPLVQAILTALGVRETRRHSPSKTLIEYLRPKRLLLVLDNCEHLVSASAHLTQTLLEQCPALHILATSRETLGVTGEVQWRVPALSLPDDLHPIAQSEAVRLFVERARQVRPDWTPSDQEYRGIGTICRRLDGLPLAVEMAAALTRTLPVEGIVMRLDGVFRLLSGPDGASVPRHRTLRAALDWSWDMLDEPEKTLLTRLSAFTGGWMLEEAEEVCVGGIDVLDVLTGLIDKSLVMFEAQDGRGRYRLLETVRQYVRERLVEAGGKHRISPEAPGFNL